MLTIRDLFYLSNENDLGAHIKVDDQLNIISILDWGGAQVVPKEAAFSAPTMMPPMPEYFGSSNVLGSCSPSVLKRWGRRSWLSSFVLRGRTIDGLGTSMEGLSCSSLFRSFFGDGSAWDGLER